ncbi:hypothetical protein KKA00_01850 [bacterium]|nr:hypothetical protein [bacterium]MBU1650935.1 hypothetical protein [bacterium]
MQNDKKTESEEILEYRYASKNNSEGDYSYNEAIMSESMKDLLKENVERP